MKKVAVIIEHPGRSNDVRVDIYTVPESMEMSEVIEHAQRKMLGPFKVIAASERINLECLVF